MHHSFYQWEPSAIAVNSISYSRLAVGSWEEYERERERMSRNNIITENS